MDFAFLPIVIIIVFALVTPILSYLTQRRFKGKIVACWSIIGLTSSLIITLWEAWAGVETRFLYGNIIVVDSFSIFFSIIFITVATLVAIASYEYMSRDSNQGEYYTLLLLATTGMMFAAFASDLLVLYLALQLMSFSTYIMVSLRKKDPRSNEAAVKYFIVSALASALILYAISLIFGAVGSINIYTIATALSSGKSSSQPITFLAVVLFIAGIGLEMAVVPFHMWIPDTYEGAPTTVTALLAGGSKMAGFAAGLRIFFVALIMLKSSWSIIFALLALFTMTLGNVAALAQTRIARMLAYSSIAQAGYILIGLATVNSTGLTGYLMQILNYSIMTSAAFLAAALAAHSVSAYTLDDYSGLSKRLPITSFAFTMTLFSLAGIPPLCGFIGKLILFTSALQTNLWWLALAGVLNSAFSLGYYIRVIKRMYIDSPKVEGLRKVSEPIQFKIVFIVTTFLILLLGIYPTIALNFVNVAISNIKL